MSAVTNQHNEIVRPKDRPQPNAKTLGIATEKPKYKDYAVLAKRLESFKQWPADFPLRPEELAEAGLVYTGVGDSVRCYYCGGGLRNWRTGDEAFREHALWYPDCTHVKLVKGKQYIEKVAEENQFGQLKDLNIQVPNLAHQSDQLKNSTRQRPNSLTSESDSGSDDASTDDYDSLVEEHARLKETQTCKVCLDTLADIIFLPCGHIVSCAQCAPALTKCPICRQVVSGYVKAYFAVDPILNFSQL